MEVYHVKEAALYAFRNKTKLSESEKAGCYNCCAVFPTNEITEWTDDNETAICPKCNVDAVLADVMVPLNEENLKSINQYWFKRT